MPPGLEVLTREGLALGRHQLGLVDAALGQQRSREQGRGLTGVRAHAQRPQSFVGSTQGRDRVVRIARDHLDHARVELRLREPVTEAQLFERGARRGEHRARDVEPATERLQHRLTPVRRGLDRG